MKAVAIEGPGMVVAKTPVHGQKNFSLESPILARPKPHETAFGCPRAFLNNRFVYTVISPRARGLSIGVNMNPCKTCNFDCAYCEVNRSLPGAEEHLNIDVMANELQNTRDLDFHVRRQFGRDFQHAHHRRFACATRRFFSRIFQRDARRIFQRFG
jgi:hypothetical protein